MNDLVITTAIQMTSGEIASLVGSRPDSVKRTIERLAAPKTNLVTGAATPAVIELPPVVEVRNHLGQRVSEYLFSGEKGKRDSLVVVAQLSPEFTAQVVDRWQELEAQQKALQPQLPDFTNPADAARAWANEFEQKQILQIENQHQAKQIESLQSLFQEGMTVPQFCKQLNGVNVQQVNTFLQKRNWLFQQGTQWRVAAYARDKYLTEHQNTITPHGKDPFNTHKPVLLKQGASRIHELYLSNHLPMKKGWDGLYTHDLEARA